MKKLRAILWAAGIVAIAMLTILVLPGNKAEAQATAQMPLAGSLIPKWMHELPSLNLVDGTTGEAFNLRMREILSPVLPPGTVPGYTGTYVWSYLEDAQAAGTKAIPSYIGPVVVAKRGTPTEINFYNELGSTATSHLLAYKHSVDQTLHWADPLGNELNTEAKNVATSGFSNGLTYPQFGVDPSANTYSGPIPAVVHLHGGEVPPVLDGGPDSWVTSTSGGGPLLSGHGYYSLGVTQGPNATFPGFTYRYPNTQQAAPIWFHDHTLGATRLNVYAGLAGGYIIQDPQPGNPNFPGPANLPAGRTGEPLIPLVLQDRMFDTNGQLFFPADSAGGILWTTNPEHPYWVPEFIGDTIVVNGKAWPTVGTAAAPLPSRRYRFLFLNGSNARTYELWLVDAVTGRSGPPLWVIGTDGGYLNTPAKIDPNAGANNRLTIMPGERYDVIIDFNDPVYRASNPSGQLIMRNSARTPYPKGGTVNPRTTGQIVKFFVAAPTGAADSSYDPAAAAPGTLRAVPIETLGTAALTRQLTLNEVMALGKTVTDPVTGLTVTYPGGPLEVVLNNTKWDGMRLNPATNQFEQIPGTSLPESHPAVPGGGAVDYYYSEFPVEGSTEIWEIVNITADAHPIHLHAVQFQILNRQNLNVNRFLKRYAAAFGGLVLEAYGPPYLYDNSNNPDFPHDNSNNHDFPDVVGGNPDVTPFVQGPLLAPKPQEAGWKDTAVSLPGQVLRIKVRWAPQDATVTGKNYYPFSPDGGHGYVWHCHIIDHEDNEMMRPVSIIVNPAAVRDPTIIF